MELTREDVMLFIISGGYDDCHRTLAKQLLVEMDKPKVWDGAPEWATVANVFYCDGISKSSVSKTYTRTLAKSPVREIAEKKAKECITRPSFTVEQLADWLEEGINEYKESVK